MKGNSGGLGLELESIEVKICENLLTTTAKKEYLLQLNVVLNKLHLINEQPITGSSSQSERCYNEPLNYIGPEGRSPPPPRYAGALQFVVITVAAGELSTNPSEPVSHEEKIYVSMVWQYRY
ncbi:hypothetical protein Y032_0583g297 [Ancylostoma ceylanicum]|uniref:Uncharacterized protein n=1 Tax=Ancylostoma ceylanicum TaxID=53326 RepID=A0A016WNB8_9BILA|nr:hypothetical protein Y032_0583g297 [Ancylostoma ceylanicum]